MLDESFLKDLPDEFIGGVLFFVQRFNRFLKFNSVPQSDSSSYENLIEYYMALEAYLQVNKYEIEFIELGADKTDNYIMIKSFYEKIEDEFQKKEIIDFNSAARLKYNIFFNNTFKYEFSQGDLDRIQEILNELRKIISNSDLFTSEHQQRLLKRLEKMQSELHKKVSNLDRFWGLIGDAGVAIGKFGIDAKPFVDRIKEISDIVWRTQARAEELPSGTHIPFLTEGEK